MTLYSVAYYSQCYMLNLRIDYVTCYYIFIPDVVCHLALCRMSNSRNAHVALSF